MAEERRKKISWLFLLAFLFLQGAVWLAVNSMVMGKTIDFSRKKEEIVALSRENALLRKKVYSLSSLTSIKQRALAEGLLPIKGIALIDKEGPVALKVALPDVNRE